MQEFPIQSKLDPAVYGPPESALSKELIEQELNGITIDKVMISRCNMVNGHRIKLALIYLYSLNQQTIKSSYYLKIDSGDYFGNFQLFSFLRLFWEISVIFFSF